MSTSELFLGDCISQMKEIHSDSVDVSISDPPYDNKTHAGARNSDSSDESPIDFAPLADLSHVGEMLRISKRWVICFCALEQLGAYRDAAGDAWVRAGAWIRTNGMPQVSGDRPAQGAEGIAIMHREGKKRWNGGGRSANWTGPISTEHEHPTQKPTWLMEALIRDFTEHGETVLDPFMGSGTTGVAAVRLGRRFVGIEKEPKYFSLAQRRMLTCHEQLTISFEPPRASTAKAKQLTFTLEAPNESK